MKKLLTILLLLFAAFLPSKAQNCVDTVFLYPQYEFNGSSLVVEYFTSRPLSGITSFQVGLEWDNNVFGFQSIVGNQVLSFNNTNYFLPTADKVNIAWVAATALPILLNPDEPLFTCSYEIKNPDAIGYIRQSDFLSELVEDPQIFAYNCLQIKPEPVDLAFGVVTGSVTLDLDKNCIKDPDAVLFNKGLIKFSKDNKDYYRIVDSLGNYKAFLNPGQYEVSMEINDVLYSLCTPNNSGINVVDDQTINDINFLVQRKVDCAVVETNIGAAFLRRCFDNTYTISYENIGSITAENARIEVVLDEDMVFVSSSKPHILQDSIVTYNLGDVNVGEKGVIYLTVNLNCNTTVLNETHCVTVKSFPNDPCFLPLNYAGSNILITGECDEVNKKVKFKLTNIGLAAMPEISEYIVIEDEVMKPPVPYTLNAQQSYLVELDANGTTYSILTQQESNFPGLSRPRAFVEGCGTNAGGTFSTGIVNRFEMDDLDPFIDILCLQNIGSYDPNDITGFPHGYGTPKYIENTTKLDYVVRFQNTGTDTAFNIVVRNVIPDEFDITTFNMANASHNYTYEFVNERELVVTFKNIELVDSFKNEALSHGYFSYEIFPKSSLKDNQLLNNKAEIYFDFNAPIQTNTEMHTIGRPIFISSVKNESEKFRINAYPNPTDDFINILLPDNRIYEYTIFDIFGFGVQKGTIQNSNNQINCKAINPGNYVITVGYDSKLIGTIKFIKN